MVGLRRIGRQLGGGQDGADEEPRSQLARNEIGVLALPAQTRIGRQRLLHQRRRVDEDLDLGAGAVRQPLPQALELALDHVMVIAIEGVDGDDAGVPVLQACHRVESWRIALRQDDGAAGIGPQGEGTGAARRPSRPSSPCCRGGRWRGTPTGGQRVPDRRAAQ